MSAKLVKLSLVYRGGECDPVKDDAFMRCVVVPAEFSLAFLHEVVQTAFGWGNYHLYAFRKGKVSYTLPDPETGALAKGEKFAARMPIGALLGKPGNSCLYEYDFGDGNVVEIVCKGRVTAIAERDFAAKGQDLIEDSSAFGFTPGIVKLLSAKKRTAKAKDCVKWLSDAFDLSAAEALYVPTAGEIAVRVSRLIDFVENAIP